MRCKKCGTEISELAVSYVKCGNTDLESERTPAEKRGILISRVLAVIVVIILIAAFAVHYYNTNRVVHPVHTPSVILTLSNVTDGVRLNFMAPTSETQWSDITIMLAEGANWVSWSPETTDLDDGMNSTADYGSKSIGLLTVCCSVTDIAGNGRINYGDYFSLTTVDVSFSSVTNYTATVMYDPFDSKMCDLTFSG